MISYAEYLECTNCQKTYDYITPYRTCNDCGKVLYVRYDIDKAFNAAKLVGSNIILKGPNTIIVSHNKTIVINDHASSELAVIGSGDVLSGLIVSLVGVKKMSPFLAGCAATWLHGDIAKNYSKGLIAEDIVKGIPSALKRLKNGKFAK